MDSARCTPAETRGYRLPCSRNTKSAQWDRTRDRQLASAIPNFPSDLRFELDLRRGAGQSTTLIGLRRKGAGQSLSPKLGKPNIRTLDASVS